MQNNFNLNDGGMEEIVEKSLLPTNDVIFHCLFGTVGNENITKNLLEKILNKNVEEIKLDLNVNLIREHYDDKLGILDVRIKEKNGTNYNIEMQNTSSEQLPQRILWYWSKLYSSDLKRGKNYNILNKTIAIIIVNDGINKFDEIKKYETKWNIREEDYKDIILTEDFEIRIIELPKYIKMKQENKVRINTWLEFILNPKWKGVAESMEEEDLIEEARKKWEKIISDKKIRDRALRREVAELDRNTAIKNATDKGFEQGIEQGKIAQKRESAIKMLRKGSSIKDIMEITGLKKAEIEEIKKDI
ncbi:MAG: Rpn family recombination-promoting nuclease/putative transposase [Clostridia bacterium]|nr:Rpn family recombination-promoting nuclease/putative transposase [Clostridia bacterium]